MWISLLSLFTKLNVSERCDAISNKICIAGIIGKLSFKLWFSINPQKLMPTNINEIITVCRKKGKDHHSVTFTLWLYASMYVITILVISTVARWRTLLTIIWRRTRDTTVLSNISFVTCCTLKQIDMSDNEYACK